MITRQKNIDVAKGICIILMVYAHIILFLKHDDIFLHDIYMFHMPLFFLVSGMFHKSEIGFMQHTKKKTIQLLYPYIFWFVTLAVVTPWFLYKFAPSVGQAIAPEYGKHFGALDAVTHIFSEQNNSNASIWFLVCLFEVSTLFHCIVKISSIAKTRIINHFLIGSITILSATAGLYLSLNKNLPYFFDSALTSLFFYGIGYFITQYNINSLANRIKRTNLFTIFVICMAVVHLMHTQRCSYMSNNYTENYIVAIAGGLIGSIGTLAISTLIQNFRLLSYIGRNTCFILCTHCYAYKIFTLIAPFNNESTVHLYANMLIVLILTITSLALIAPLFNKYLPLTVGKKKP